MINGPGSAWSATRGPLFAGPRCVALTFRCPENIAALAGGAATGSARSERHFPGVVAFRTLEFPCGVHPKRSPLDPQGLALDQGLRDFFACGVDDSAEGLPGDVHLLSGLLLVGSFKIGKPDSLKLVNRQNHFF